MVTRRVVSAQLHFGQYNPRRQGDKRAGHMYVDHAATTAVRPEVLAAMLPYFADQWGNPSSLNGPCRRAARAVATARATVADNVNCSPDEIVFTGSGSEGANLAVKGVALAAMRTGKRHLVISRIEHHAVLDSCRWLVDNAGFTLTEVEVDADGRIDLAHLERSITDQTALVSVMFANNEIGTLQPIADVVRIAHARGVPVHTDAVQAPSSMPIDIQTLDVDLLSIAAHKFYGPQGIGALYIRRGTRLMPHVHGGGQERHRRSGTENVAGIVGLATALELAQSECAASNARLRGFTRRLLTDIPARTDFCRVTGPTNIAERLPGHASFVLKHVESASLLLALDRDDIWASSGSACTSGASEPSHVLVALGLDSAWLFGALRLTLGRDTCDEDIDRLVDVLPAAVRAVRRSVLTTV
ncbi:MAG: cysteine desulfurase family protein [Chloroflexota bacterium]